jgi:hypothetical protein
MAEIEFKVKSMVKTHKGTIPVFLHVVMVAQKKFLGFLQETVLTYLTYVGQFETDTDLRTSDITNG